MKLSRNTRIKIAGSALAVEEVELILTRLEAAAPHLTFGMWEAGHLASNAEVQSEVRWKNGRQALEVAIDFEEGLRLWSLCSRYSGPVSHSDYYFLLSLALEAWRMIHSRLGGALSLLDFGTQSVAEEIKRMASLEGNIVSTLRFVRSLSHETYENQRLTYGIILSGRGTGTHPIAGAFENKRLKRLTDGFSTALVVDENEQIMDYTTLVPPGDEGLRLTRRPWWAAGLAEASKHYKGAGVALVRNGDVIVVHEGKLLFSQRSGRWNIWNHTAIVARLRSCWGVKGPRGNVDRVLHYLYHVALDLSFRRSGGLLIVLNNKASLKKLLLSTTDRVGSKGRGPAELAFDEILRGRKIQNLDRRFVTDLASLDGAVVVDRMGNILAYGAMSKSAAGAQQGARTRAAVAASRLGIAIKASSDGQISFFSD